MDLNSVPLGEELHVSGTADLRIDTKDDLFTSGEVFRKLYLSSFGVDSIAKFCLGILIGNPEQCTSHILRPCVSHSTWFDGIFILSILFFIELLSERIPSQAKQAWLGGRKVGRGQHSSRSICILKECGVELTSDERFAILNHHPRGFGKWVSIALKSPLQLLLQMGDCRSTGLNKRGQAYRFSSI